MRTKHQSYIDNLSLSFVEIKSMISNAHKSREKWQGQLKLDIVCLQRSQKDNYWDSN